MTDAEIWSLAIAGDGSLDPALAQDLGMPLKEFKAEKQRRIEQAAADREQQEELNRQRSIGSIGGDAVDIGPFEDPTEAARQHLERMEDAYHADKPLDGQQTLPGFEVQEEPAAPAPLDAETIKKNIGRVSFKVDYMKSPEDALIDYNAPSGVLSHFLSKHFNALVKIAAEQTGADPEQIADKDRRTPEQDRLLMEIAGRMSVARIHAFFASTYYNALSVLEPLQGTFKDPRIKEQYTEEELLTDFDADSIPIKEQAALYFFATHESIKPTEAGELTEEQAAELRETFFKMDSFFTEKAAEDKTGPEEPDGIFTKYFTAFIEHENPAEGIAEQIAEAVKESLPVVSSLIPKNYIIPNNALANALVQKQLIEDPETATGWNLPVSNAKGKRKEITSYTMVTYDPGETGVTITDAKLTRHERAVTNGIVSLWVEAADKGKQPIFTVDQIFRAMPGGSDKAGTGQKGAITKAIDKFTRLRIYVNATEEMQKRGVIKEGGKYVFDEYFLNVRRHVVKTENGGKTVQAYEILSQPVIYTYSKLVNQIITVPAKYTAIQRVKENPKTKRLEASGEYLSMTVPRQAMTDYLLQRIAILKHDFARAKDDYRAYNNRRRRDKTLEEKPLAAFMQQSDIILFDSLFADAGLSDQDKITAKRNRDFVYEVLDYQTVAGNIKGYEKQTKGQRTTGVKILL